MPDVQKPEYQVHVMGDAAEIIRYDRAAVPLYIRQGSLSCYSHRRALIHWHDDLEFIRVYEGRMRYAVNARDLLLGPGDVLVVNSRQMHGGRAADENDCRFLCVLVRPQLLTGSPVLYREQVRPFVEQPGLECLHFAAGTPPARRRRRGWGARWTPWRTPAKQPAPPGNWRRWGSWRQFGARFCRRPGPPPPPPARPTPTWPASGRWCSLSTAIMPKS